MLFRSKDVTSGLINLGASELGNAATGQITSFVNSANDAVTGGGDTSTETKATDSDVDSLVKEINSANDTKDDSATTVGGLTAVSDASLSGTAGTTKADDTTSTGASDLFGSGADDSFALTGGKDISAGTGDVDTTTPVGGLTATSGATDTVAGGTTDDTSAATTATTKPVTGGLTQAQQDLINAGTAVDVGRAADAATVGGLNQVAGDQDSTTNAATTAATTGAVAGAGSNLISNIKIGRAHV